VQALESTERERQHRGPEAFVIHRALALVVLVAAAAWSSAACSNPGCEPYSGNAGACNNFVGYTWNGSRCVPQRGCLCEGDQCPGVYAQLTTCEAEHQMCLMDSSSDVTVSQ
jgi:hypothetical protein